MFYSLQMTTIKVVIYVKELTGHKALNTVYLKLQPFALLRALECSKLQTIFELGGRETGLTDMPVVGPKFAVIINRNPQFKTFGCN